MKPLARVPRICFLLVLGALLIGGCQAVAVTPPPPTAAPMSALEACQLPATSDKGGSTLTFQWQTTVEMIVPTGEILVFTSGLDSALCEAFRSPDGSWGNTVVGIGHLDPADPAALTYDTGVDAVPANPRIIAAGRAPSGTTRIEATASGGSSVFSVLRAGFYVVRVDGSGPLTSIVAFDGSGAELARLTAPAGLQPPMTSRATAPSP